MKAWIPLTLALALGSVAHAEDCTYPRAPDAVPDGNTATKDQMMASKNDISRYNTEMNAYLDCVSRQIDAAKPKDGAKLSKDEKAKADGQVKMLTEKHDAAVDELHAVAQRFNDQVKAFKAKQQPQ
jgi:hypothetical protein